MITPACQTQYECLLCDEPVHAASIVEHLVEAHGLDEMAVTKAKGELVSAEDGPDWFVNTFIYEANGQRIVRVIREGKRGPEPRDAWSRSEP